MAAAISRIDGATAQIVAYDVGSRITRAAADARSLRNSGPVRVERVGDLS
jgi:hypothetical protein